MKLVILHYHKRCPECGQITCFFVDFQSDEDGTKLPSGFYECNNCQSMIPSEQFHSLQEVAPTECKYQNLAINSVEKSSELGENRK